MFVLTERTDSIMETYDLSKIIEEQIEDVFRCSNLPYYLRILQQKRDVFYIEYAKTKERAYLITHYKLNEIFEDEMGSLNENGTIIKVNSLTDLLEVIKKEMLLSEFLYRITNMITFWDMHVGLYHVKAVLFGIGDLKRVEHELLRVID